MLELSKIDIKNEILKNIYGKLESSLSVTLRVSMVIAVTIVLLIALYNAVVGFINSGAEAKLETSVTGLDYRDAEELLFAQQEQVIVDENLVLCESCGREWDGHAQCPCGMGYVTDTNAARLLFGYAEDPYYGEYEIAEDSPENNSEIAKEIKDTVKELGEQLFDLQEKLSEGEYLKMMDLLQKITNKTNSL